MIEFSQSAWLKPCIGFKTKLRARPGNSNFEKDFYKLMNNSVFGKTIESVRKHKVIKLVTNKNAYLRKVMKPNFKSGILFRENLMACEMGKTKVLMNKPVYLGQAILNLSKIVMYKFHYDYMMPKYGGNLNLCYMDTDSFVYHITTKDFYEDIAGDVKESPGGHSITKHTGGLARRSESKTPNYLSKNSNIKKMLKSYPLNILKVQSDSSKISNLGQIFIFTENCTPNYPYESF